MAKTIIQNLTRNDDLRVIIDYSLAGSTERTNIVEELSPRTEIEIEIPDEARQIELTSAFRARRISCCSLDNLARFQVVDRVVVAAFLEASIVAKDPLIPGRIDAESFINVETNIVKNLLRP